MVESAYLAVVAVGLLHGLEPSHGWPVATLYATRFRKPIFRGFLSSWIISMAHLVSSLAVVIPFVLFRAYLGITLPYANYIAGGALLLLSLKMILEKPRGDLEDQHDHTHDNFEGEHQHNHVHPNGTTHSHKHTHARRAALTLSGIAVFALILGFTHEEEFVLLSLAVSGIDPLFLMVSYALAVMAGLIGMTLISVRIYKILESKIRKYEPLIPKITSLVLVVTALTFMFGLR